MAELVVVGFETIHEADRALNELMRLQKEYLIDLEDAVVVTRDPGGKIHLKQSFDLVGTSAALGGLRGAMWGSLVGLLFLNPLIGLAAGAALGAGAGAMSGSLIDFGINDDFIRSIAQTLQPDTSALFVLVRKAQPEKVLSDISQFRGRVIRSSLSPEQESRLQAALSDPAIGTLGGTDAVAGAAAPVPNAVPIAVSDGTPPPQIGTS